MPMIFFLIGKEWWNIETADFAGLWSRMGHSQLYLTVVQIIKEPQLQHIGHVNRHKVALVGYKCKMANLVVMSIIYLLFVALEREDFDYSRASTHSQHTLVLVDG